MRSHNRGTTIAHRRPIPNEPSDAQRAVARTRRSLPGKNLLRSYRQPRQSASPSCRQLLARTAARVLVDLLNNSLILAVLTRDEDGPARVVLDGDARIEAPTGRLDLAADERASITSGNVLSMLRTQTSCRSKQRRANWSSKA